MRKEDKLINESIHTHLSIFEDDSSYYNSNNNDWINELSKPLNECTEWNDIIEYHDRHMTK